MKPQTSTMLHVNEEVQLQVMDENGSVSISCYEGEAIPFSCLLTPEEALKLAEILTERANQVINEQKQ